MTKSNNELDLKNLPTLSEVLLVEETLQNIERRIITTSELKKILNGKITENTLMIVIDYLEAKNKIAITSKGITWIHDKQKLLKSLDKLLEKSELTEKDAIEMGRKIKHNMAKRYGLLK
jgi:hypothetical protein